MKSRSPLLLFLLAVLFCVATPITSPAQALTTLYSFCSQPSCPDGQGVAAGLIQASDGNFYGVTYAGGVGQYCPFYPNGGCGTVFRITPAGTLTTLYNFCSQPTCADGADPLAGLVQATDGNLYGTTDGGGVGQYCPFYPNGGCGTVFRITMSGSFTTLYSFCTQANCTDGAAPVVGLVQATDGNLYSTTSEGGNTSGYEYGYGTAFKITPSGALTTIYRFCSQPNCTDGSSPHAGLVQASDGNFYGTTTEGGATFTGGTVFKITPSGTLTVLYSFCSQNDCTDGTNPAAGLVQGRDGNFYGTTGETGTVFKITPSGTLTTLWTFCSQPNCADGNGPDSALVQASDGNLYSTTYEGGTYNPNCPLGCGTIFKITPTGLLATLYNFCSLPNCVDGYGPEAPVTQGTDGNFYSTTSNGGNGVDDGTVFRLLGPIPTPLQLVPITPCRLVDTRQKHDPIQGGTWQAFVIPQLGVCNIPTTAAAYSLNVTVAPHGPLGYLTIWPTGENQPLVSTMNSPDGRVKANAAIVPAGANEAVSVYATDTTDVILDIDGYFIAPGSQTYQFYSLTPCRVVDTRAGSNEPQGLGPPSLSANQTRDLPILSSPCLQGITNPLAYSFNVTVVPNPAGQPLGYLTVWPSNQTQPVVSTLNNPSATVVANAAIVPAAPTGDIDVYAYNSTDLIIDINGYFAAPGQNGLSMYPVAPCRVLDTRNNNGQPFMGEKTVNVMGSTCAPPSSAQGYIFNATVVPPGQMPYLTLWPDAQQQPVVSTLNAYDGFITSNMAIVPTTNGSIDAYAAGLTHLILDISGYFAP
jgi:uncharacterized repeat protein (TIGR03803 family)